MSINLSDKIGNWNPQLLRELKGSFQPTKMVGIVIFSLLVQIGIFTSLSGQKCLQYIGSECTQSQLYIHWEIIYRVLDWMLPVLLLIGGVYILIGDVANEERQGTLNFIRLSPQPSQSILLGKILGSPGLLYLGILLAIPLHFVSALAAGLPFFWILGIYSLWVAGCWLLYGIFLTYTFLYAPNVEAKSLAGSGSFLGLILALPYIGAIDLSFDGYKYGFFPKEWRWLFFPIGKQPLLAYLLMLITVSIASYWFWQAINRRFGNPKATLLSKKQSYWLVASFQFWLLGFATQNLVSVTSDFDDILGFAFLFFINPVFFLLLNMGLFPDRQSVLDWTRYRRNRISHRKGFWNSDLVRDLIGHEKSPAVVAIGINYLIATLIWLPWILVVAQKSWHQNYQTFLVLMGGLILTMNGILIYTAIPELMRFVNRPKKLIFVGITGGIILLAVLGLQRFVSNPIALQMVLGFSPFPVLIVAFNSLTTILVGVVVQLSVLSFLSVQLTRQLKKAGESESKAMLTGNRA